MSQEQGKAAWMTLSKQDQDYLVSHLESDKVSDHIDLIKALDCYDPMTKVAYEWLEANRPDLLAKLLELDDIYG
jgi:hypothetical protein